MKKFENSYRPSMNWARIFTYHFKKNCEIFAVTALLFNKEILGFLMLVMKWASSQENLSLWFPTKRVSNQSPQLQRLAKKLKFHLQKVNI